jgi:hypothetical protein
MPIIFIYIDLINNLPYEFFSKCGAKKAYYFSCFVIIEK